MNSPEIALFLWLNAGPQTPGAIITLARYVSLYLPALSIAALLAVAAWRPAWRAVFLRTVVAMLLAWVAGRLLRHGIAMPRPAALGLGIQWIGHASGPGMPSLHTAGAFAFASSVSHSRIPRAVKMGAWVIAALIGWSRLCLGVHFPLDVIFGAAVGPLSAKAAHRLLATMGRRTAAVHASSAEPVH